MTDWQVEEDRLKAIRDLPVEPYVGLELKAAETRALAEGRSLRILESLDGPRTLDLVYVRINVEVDDTGRVIGADAG